jgi:sugar phosphate isomerase/epimerase
MLPGQGTRWRQHRGMSLSFALNRMCVPRRPFTEFAAMARCLGAGAIEIRNDLAQVELEDATPAREVGAIARAHGLVIRSINALQRFEQIDAVRAAEAQALMACAARCGAWMLPAGRPAWGWCMCRAWKILRWRRRHARWPPGAGRCGRPARQRSAVGPTAESRVPQSGVF